MIGRNILNFSIAVLLFWSTFTQVFATDAIDRNDQANVIFILLDNVGQEWFGCYGSEEGCTPNIDALAKDSVRVEHCYTTPICGPSRIQLLTGRQPYRTGYRLHHDAALYSGGGLDPARETTFPKLFQEAGYVTGIVGKWQINNLYDEPDAMMRHGFSEHLVWPGSIDRGRVSESELAFYRDAVVRESAVDTGKFMDKIESRYWDAVFIRNGRREVNVGKFGPDVAQDFAIDFLRRHRERPFLLYYPMLLTHGQSFMEPVVATPSNRESQRPHHEMFADMLRYADRLVGELLTTLDALKLRNKTYVFLASDNGTESSLTARCHGRSVHGGLYTLSEAGGSVAMLVHHPQNIPGGRTMPLGEFSDVLPTLCELCEVRMPDNLALDGKSWADFLQSKGSGKAPREWIFNQLYRTRVVRDGSYKLYSSGSFFDMRSDPDEKHPLAGDIPRAAAEARTKLEQALKSLPPDAPPPFPLRSQSVFKLPPEERAALRP